MEKDAMLEQALIRECEEWFREILFDIRSGCTDWTLSTFHDVADMVEEIIRDMDEDIKATGDADGYFCHWSKSQYTRKHAEILRRIVREKAMN